MACYHAGDRNYFNLMVYALADLGRDYFILPAGVPGRGSHGGVFILLVSIGALAF